jgi:hypothetical protein
VWDLTGELRRGGPPPTLTAKALAGLWADLAGEDAAKAYHAIQDLAAAPKAAVPYLAARLRPAAAADPKREKEVPSGERLRLLRALEVLERAGDAAAREVLARLAKGAAEARLTQEARQSLERLKKRAPAPK